MEIERERVRERWTDREIEGEIEGERERERWTDREIEGEKEGERGGRWR